MDREIVRAWWVNEGENTTLKSVAKDSDSDPETCSSSVLFCLLTLISIKPEMELVFLLKTNEISLDLFTEE